MQVDKILRIPQNNLFLPIIANIMLTPEELTRYSRHFILPEIGKAGQEKLKTARILCVGAGGLSSPLLLYLAAAGIGTLGIIDDDTVELSNLQRQVLYTEADIGTKKIESARARLQQLNPQVNIELHATRLTAANVLAIVEKYDIVADGSDNFATRYLINDACFQLKKPDVYASIFQFQGQCSVFWVDKGPCYRCLYEDPSVLNAIPNCAQAGVLGVLPGIMGSIQATEVIKLILNIGTSLVGRVLQFDALTMRFQEYLLHKNPQCPLCAHKQSFAELSVVPQTAQCTHYVDNEITVEQLHDLFDKKADFNVLDVREPYEYAQYNIGGELIPLTKLPYQLENLDRTKLLIVCCRVGERSRYAVQFLREEGFNAVNLAGGLLAWEMTHGENVF